MFLIIIRLSEKFFFQTALFVYNTILLFNLDIYNSLILSKKKTHKLIMIVFVINSLTILPNFNLILSIVL